MTAFAIIISVVIFNAITIVVMLGFSETICHIFRLTDPEHDVYVSNYIVLSVVYYIIPGSMAFFMLDNASWVFKLFVACFPPLANIFLAIGCLLIFWIGKLDKKLSRSMKTKESKLKR